MHTVKISSEEAAGIVSGFISDPLLTSAPVQETNSLTGSKKVNTVQNTDTEDMIIKLKELKQQETTELSVFYFNVSIY